MPKGRRLGAHLEANNFQQYKCCSTRFPIAMLIDVWSMLALELEAIGIQTRHWPHFRKPSETMIRSLKSMVLTCPARLFKVPFFSHVLYIFLSHSPQYPTTLSKRCSWSLNNQSLSATHTNNCAQIGSRMGSGGVLGRSWLVLGGSCRAIGVSCTDFERCSDDPGL